MENLGSMNSQNSIEELSSQVRNEKKNTKPPCAPLVLRIAVTGHRTESDDLPLENRKRSIPDIPALLLSIHQVLDVIQVAFRGIASTNSDLFDLKPSKYSQPDGGTLRIISALASGADQWVASEAIKLGFELQSILPFKRDEYLKDFKVQAEADSYLELLCHASEVFELDGKVDYDETGTRIPDSLSYEAVGRGILNQTDLLIAIWDGKDSHGRGGTGQVVREALQNGIPVICIPWTSPEKWQIHRSSWQLLEEFNDLSGDSDRLAEMIRKLLLPPEEKHQIDFESVKSLRTEYFNENQKKGNPQLGLWMLFRSLICGEVYRKMDWNRISNAFLVKDFVKDETQKSEAFWNKKSEDTKRVNPIEPAMQGWINERYNTHYAWANGLSVYYGDMYRSAFLINYILGAIAVFLALVCIAFGITGREQAGWIIAELFIIIGILTLTYQGRNRKWHQRWIDYRTLAEHLRLSRCMVLLGGGSTKMAYEAHLSTYGNPAHTWMNWHYRAIERAAGLPGVTVDEHFLASCQEIWRDGLIKSQINYHQTSQKRFGKMNERLHKIGNFLFIATLISCLFHLLHLWIEHDHRFTWIPENTGDWMTVLCAFLPALGAAFASIRSHSEVQRLDQRSKAMEDTLTKFQSDLAGVSVASNDLNSIKLRNHANRVNDLMTNEMLDWRVVFQDRPLGLPA